MAEDKGLLVGAGTHAGRGRPRLGGSAVSRDTVEVNWDEREICFIFTSID
jgi:hypothetical protein